MSRAHRDAILDQFTRQATPFATSPGIKDEAALRLVVEFSGTGAADTVLVVDTAPPPDKAEAFNRVEKLRDPSHVRGMPLAEHLSHFAAVGLPAPRRTAYRLEGELEGLLQRSFPNPGDDVEIRRIFADSIAHDALGLDTRRVGDTIHFGYPIAVLASRKP